MDNKKTIIRVEKNKDNPYVRLDKRCLNDINLSWKAKGLHTYLLSLPDDWKIYICELVKHSKDGRDSTSSAITELMEFGYIVRSKIRNKIGQFKGYEYIVYEVSQYDKSISNIDVNSCSAENVVTVIGCSNNGKSVANNKELNKQITKLNKTTTTNVEKVTDNDSKKETVVVADIIIDPVPVQETKSDNKVQAYKVKIDTVIGDNISAKMVNKLLITCGEDKIDTYLNNWDKFKATSKKSIVGFFVDAVQNDYSIPKQEVGSVNSVINSNIGNMTNFDQREYSADYFEQFYYKVG